jgi:predicted house-cleaning noncanonical NTP pyrophosphatase (MazG superfamily)
VINSASQCLVSTTSDGKHLLAGIESRSTQGRNFQNLLPTDTKAAWHALWEGLHHQGDVGEASYAAVPHLVQIYRQRGVVEWNTYAIVAVVELARDSGKNPEVPEWLKEDYLQAIRVLAEAGAAELLKAKNSEDIQAILSILAIAAGARTHAKFLINYFA